MTRLRATRGRHRRKYCRDQQLSEPLRAPSPSTASLGRACAWVPDHFPTRVEPGWDRASRPWPPPAPGCPAAGRTMWAPPVPPPAAADVLVDPAYVPKFTPFTEEDAAWLASAQHAKMLDRSLRVLGVADRHPVTGHPRVLVTYPLRVMCDDARSVIRGFSTTNGKRQAWHGPRALAQHLAVLPGVHRPGRHPRADRAHQVVPGATQ